MKTSIRNATLIILAVIALQLKSQNITICAGNSTVLTALNNSNLSNPTFSMNPGGITSSNPTFTVTPAFASTYTLYTTGTNSNSAVVTTTNTASVSVEGVSYSLQSSSNAFTLGCASHSLLVLNILNGQTGHFMLLNNIIPNGGPVSYSLLPPGSSSVLPNFTLSTATSYSVNAPGIYTVVVRGNTNLCTDRSTINIIANQTPPVIGNVSASQNPITCSNPTVLVQATANPSLQYSWLPYGGSSNSTTVFATIPASINPTPPPTVINVTLVVTDPINLCSSNTVVQVYQNLYKPNVLVNNYLTIVPTCVSSILLTNNSITGIPNNSFPNSLPVIGSLWEGPSPQPTLANSTTYTAQSIGIYTMTGTDMNNGCTNTATYNVTSSMLRPSAAFTHTVTNGLASFNDSSTGTVSNCTYLWDFGDGYTSTSQHPTHTYNSSGSHLVKLKVTNPGSFCMDSVVQSISVSGIPCTANSNFLMVPTATAQIWNVVPSYPWNVTAASWNWGDGNVSNTLYSSHQYSAAGLYNICLSVTVSCVSTSTTCTTYSVYRASQAALVLEVHVKAPDLVTGLTPSNQDEKFSWDIVPNPNAGEFALRLNVPKSEPVRFKVYDITGRIVHEQVVDAFSNDVRINASKLPQGMYLISLESDAIKSTKRLVINH